MGKFFNAFLLDEDANGVFVVANKDRLTNACASEGVVDSQIATLKAELDAMATQMKAMIRDNDSRPLFDAKPDA